MGDSFSIDPVVAVDIAGTQAAELAAGGDGSALGKAADKAAAPPQAGSSETGPHMPSAAKAVDADISQQFAGPSHCQQVISTSHELKSCCR